jgi:hypothetical protein
VCAFLFVAYTTFIALVVPEVKKNRFNEINGLAFFCKKLVVTKCYRSVTYVSKKIPFEVDSDK